MSDGALHRRGYSSNVILGALYRSGRTLVKVGLQARGEAKGGAEGANRGEVVGVRVAKDDHIVGIKGYARSCVTVGQAMEEAKVNRTQQHGVQHVDDQGEEHGRDRVALTKAVSVIDRRPWVAIDEDSGGCRGEENRATFAPAVAKPNVPEGFKNDTQCFEVVKQPRGLLNQEKIVVDALPRDERALVCRD